MNGLVVFATRRLERGILSFSHKICGFRRLVYTAILHEFLVIPCASWRFVPLCDYYLHCRFFANHAGSSDAAEQKIIMPKVYELDIPLLYHFIELLVRTLGE
jgi:hypothetical protein